VSDAAPGQGARGSTETVALSQAQQSFARRVAESKATAPHVYFEVELSPVPSLPELAHGAAAALRAVPALNGAYRDGGLELYSRANVAFAVEAADTLLFPVIHDADTKDATAIAAEMDELAEQARSGSLTAPAFAGATFTIIDMRPAERFTPVIGRGQAATLGVGGRALTLACDNRIVQGREGVDFLSRLADQR
jgi:pyruvate dehydrogenase E2 component (dihydrolipoamide acetyltransferase)